MTIRVTIPPIGRAIIGSTAHSLEKIIPGFVDEAPIERRVAREKISFLTADSAVTMDYQTARSMRPEEQSYTILRGKFDQWFMEKAESVGAQPIPGVRVEELIVRDGKVCGVKAGDEPPPVHQFRPHPAPAAFQTASPTFGF